MWVRCVGAWPCYFGTLAVSCSSTKDRLIPAKSFEYNGDENRLKSDWIMPNNLLERILRLITPITDCGVALIIKKKRKHNETLKLWQNIFKKI